MISTAARQVEKPLIKLKCRAGEWLYPHGVQGIKVTGRALFFMA